jgi:hypothetical protein
LIPRIPHVCTIQTAAKHPSSNRIEKQVVAALVDAVHCELDLPRLPLLVPLETHQLARHALLVGTWIAVFLRMHSSVRGWIDFLLRDSAYGVVKEDGIQYRSMLRSRFVPWSSVERIEYSPRNGNRIDVFKVGAFTFTQVRPVHFGPAPANAIAVQEIANIGQLGAIKKLVTTDSLPGKFLHL